MATAMTTSGDLIQATGSGTFARLGTGTSGQYLTTNGTTNSWGSITGLPTNWTARTPLGNMIRTIGYNETNLYVAAGTAGTLMTSPDGITWTARTSGFGANSIYKVSFGNGLWVAVGANGTITTSTDGITWTARTANMSSNDIYDAQYANSIWVAVGAGGAATNTGGITYSTNGTTWTRKSQTLTIGGNYYGVAYNGSNWIVGANIATNNFLYASAPSGTWTVGSTTSGQDIYHIFYDGTRTLEVNSAGQLRFSTSATFGTTTLINGITLNTTPAEARCFYYSGKIFNVGTFFLAVSTTPFTGNYVNITNPSVVAPMTYHTGAGGVNQNASCVFAGAAGYMVGSASPGLLFTSF